MIKSITNKLVVIICLSTIYGCINEPKSEQQKSNNTFKGNTITISKTFENDPISSDLIYDLKFIELSDYKQKKSLFITQKIMIVDDRIYLFDSHFKELYCFDLQGKQLYYLDISKHRTKNNEKIKPTDFFVQGNRLSIVDTEYRILATFDQTNLLSTKKIPFWTQEVAATENNNLIIYQGQVNDDFGTPSYFINTDTNFNIKKKYFPVSSTDIKAGQNIGASQYHIFKTEATTNLLIDLSNTVYKYPHLDKPAFKIDFVGHNVDVLSAVNIKFPSPSDYGFATIDTFWENNKHIIFHYFFNKKSGYAVVDKKSKNVLNRYPIMGLTDVALTSIGGVYHNNFFCFVEKTLIEEISKGPKDKQALFKQYLSSRKSNSSVLLIFKLKEF